MTTDLQFDIVNEFQTKNMRNYSDSQIEDIVIGLTKNIENKIKSDIVENKSNIVSNQSKGCFIATACYGNYNAPEVLILRKYRDDVLLNTIIGTAFVKFYYFVSPPLAKQLEKYDKAKSFVRKHILQPIVKKLTK